MSTIGPSLPGTVGPHRVEVALPAAAAHPSGLIEFHRFRGQTTQREVDRIALGRQTDGAGADTNGDTDGDQPAGGANEGESDDRDTTIITVDDVPGISDDCQAIAATSTPEYIAATERMTDYLATECEFG